MKKILIATTIAFAGINAVNAQVITTHNLSSEAS